MPAVARKGDMEAPHCSVPSRMGHFRTVVANGIPMSGRYHLNTPHTKPCGDICCGHIFILVSGSPDVFAEGRPVGRVGDPTCTVVIQGSRNVYANGGGPSFSLAALATSMAGSAIKTGFDGFYRQGTIANPHL